MTTSPERKTLVGAADKADGGDRAEMIRSEEQLMIATQVRVSDRAVLRKYVVTETVTQSFQVRREEVRLERHPAVADGNSGTAEGREPFHDGPVVEMVLYREVPRVTMEVVATERIQLHIDTVTTQVHVSDDVRREQLTVEPTAPKF